MNSPEKLSTTRFITACTALASLFVLHSVIVGYSSDDGYIALQYVKNLIEGNGIVYNVGERVEGYNNFLWIVLVAAVSKLLPFLAMIHVAEGLGILFGALTVLLVCKFSRMVHANAGILGLLAGCFIALHSGLAAWATGALETTLYAFLLFAAAYAYVFYLKTRRRFLAVPILFALATMTRPDAILLFGATVLHLVFVQIRNERRVSVGPTFACIGVFIAIYLPYFLWRYSYYGYLLPNTFYAKVGGSAWARAGRGVAYLRSYLTDFGFFVFIPPLILLLKRARTDWVDYFALLVATYLAYLIYVGGDGLAFFRFVSYVAPLMYLLVQEGLIYLYEKAKQMRVVPIVWKTAVVVLVFTSLGFTCKSSIFPLIFKSKQQWYEPQSELSFPDTGRQHGYLWFDNYFVDRQAIAARWLEENAPPGALIASTPAGSIAFHLKSHKVIDMLGLNDVHIAHTKNNKMGKGRPGHEKGDGKYVLSRSPDYILMGNVAVLPFALDEKSMQEKLVRKSEKEIWASPEFHRDYELQCVRLAENGVFRYFTFYKKRELPSSIQAKDSSTNIKGGTQ